MKRSIVTKLRIRFLSACPESADLLRFICLPRKIYHCYSRGREGARPICQVPKRCMKYGDHDMQQHVSSLSGVTELRQFWDKLSVKPPLTSFEMTVLSCINLCPTQLTSSSWTVLAYFQLHCHNWGVVPTMKLFFFFYQLGQNSAGQPWHFAKGIHPFWLEKQNRHLFSFVWSKASRFPSVEEKDIFPQEAGIVKRISQCIEAVRVLASGYGGAHERSSASDIGPFGQ
ncbi:Growth arrest-specific protein 8 [Senna tora]|uniref:Growth arrest-specific protein 8 n=1 Tax=Senna tora TaxID=362788 RepID=A0A835C281_9FABA|nr:Growth arrest-specific protein 8 [Senna tora]